MAHYKMTLEQERELFKKVIPDVLPEDLNECMKIFEKIFYNCYGFPMIMMNYNTSFNYWDVGFRNPTNITNPDIKGKDPKDAVHKFLNFLKYQL